MFNNTEQVVDFFKNRFRDIDGIYDVILRGSLLDSEFVCDWSDIDLSVIINKNNEQVWTYLNSAIGEARRKFPIKISVTIVDYDDCTRELHNHGIKPMYYTKALADNSKSLLGKPLCFSEKQDSLLSDVYYNVLFLVHDIRNNYITLDKQSEDFVSKCRHILKRTCYVIKNAAVLIQGKENIEKSSYKLGKILSCSDPEFIGRLFSLKKEWHYLIKDNDELFKLATYASMLCTEIFKNLHLHLDKRSRCKRKNLVVFTDCSDVAFSEIYGSLKVLFQSSGISCDIEPMVKVENFSIINAAFLIRLMADIYSDNTVFLVIVNATRDNPLRIFGETKNGIVFIGNNSGYFSLLLKNFGIKKLYLTKNNRDVDNRSFGGRNVQVPTAAKLLAGVSYDVLGDELDPCVLKELDLPEGTVVHIDNFGLVKILKICSNDIRTSSSVDVYVNGKYAVSAKFSKKMKTCNDGEWILFEGSSLTPPLLELANVRNENSAAALGVKIGDVITFKVRQDK